MLDEEMELLAEFLNDAKEVWTFDGPVHWTSGFPGGSQGNPRTTRSYAWGQYLKPLNLNHESY